MRYLIACLYGFLRLLRLMPPEEALPPPKINWRLPVPEPEDFAHKEEDGCVASCGHNLSRPESKVIVGWDSATGELQMACSRCHQGPPLDINHHGCRCSHHPHLEMVETGWDNDRLVLNHDCLLCNPSLFEPCPCCGNGTLIVSDFWQTCPVCLWHDDPFTQDESAEDLSQYQLATRPVEYDPLVHAPCSGHLTLAAARANYGEFGACNEAARRLVVSETQFQNAIETGLYGESDWQSQARNRWPEAGQNVVIRSADGQVIVPSESSERAPAQPAVDADGWPIGEDGWE